jgi:hypothetical protein
MTHDQGQHSFAVILGDADGDERFRTMVMAYDREQAVEKAALIAERLNVKIELVEPAENLPIATRPAEEMAEDEEPERGSGLAGSAPEG